VDQEWFDYLVGQLGIADRLSHRPNEMSGGQQQRVACARALMARPDLIFADEPTGNLDSNASGEMLEFLRRSVSEFGQSIVMVTHDARGAAFADHPPVGQKDHPVGERLEPTVDSILELMKRLDD
jgi:putative ABC transport system ATP-binding protein